MVDDRQLAVDELRKWIDKHPDEFREGTERGKRDIKFQMDNMQQWRREHPNRWMAIPTPGWLRSSTRWRP